jgi:hypothetical protein
MRNFREEEKIAITKFVSKNFSFRGEKRKEAIQYHLTRVIGSKNDIMVILKENEGFLGIDRKGGIVDV